ncbi:MAG TPA: class I SAM-dependent methyltransferase [Candidatus Brocadiia bacterium]|nr:class I SAM-dependent methyltransferase [Candidatus Brocadiia bacterium]
MSDNPRIYDDWSEVERLAVEIGEKAARDRILSNFEKARAQLDSSDVIKVYDAEYLKHLDALPVWRKVKDVFPVKMTQKPTFSRIEAMPSGARVLDVGCGAGDFVLALAALGHSCAGLDTDANAVREALRRRDENAGLFRVKPEFFVGRMDSFEYEGRADAITLNDVVEHVSVRELRPALAHIRSLLAGGGELLIHTPNGNAQWCLTERNWKVSLWEIVQRLRGIAPPEKSLKQVYYEQTHINVMSFRALRELLSETGFDAEVRYDERDGAPIIREVASSNMMVIARPRKALV